MERISIFEKLDQIQDYWNPRIVAELNGQEIRLVKLKGEFVWHKHDHEDELFYVVKGCLRMEFRDKTVIVGENEMILVPCGVEHRPVAPQEVAVILFEPASTKNTGNIKNSQLTRQKLGKI